MGNVTTAIYKCAMVADWPPGMAARLASKPPRDVAAALTSAAKAVGRWWSDEARTYQLAADALQQADPTERRQ